MKHLISIALLIFVVFCGSPSSHMATLTLQPAGTAGIDTFILAPSPTQNRATDSFIDIGTLSTGVRRGLIYFDISEIPLGSTINSATLSLWLQQAGSWNSDNNRTLAAYRVKRAWTETGATWNSYDGVSNWATAGAFDATDAEQTDVGTTALATTDGAGSQHDITLSTAAISEWVEGTFTNNGLLLKLTTESADDMFRINSSDYGIAGSRPKLVIDYTPPANSITLQSPVAYQTYQRDSNGQADIAISGIYNGTPTAIEASFNGGDYVTIDAAPAGSTFSGTLSNQAAGQGTLTVRFTNDTSINDSAAYVGVGDVFLVAGQSNAEGNLTNLQSYSHATLKATMHQEVGTWAELADPTDADKATGSPWPLLATLHMADQGVPVAFITVAEDGAGLGDLDPDWQKGHTVYDNAVTVVGNTGVNDIKAVLWHQGERDAGLGVPQANYQTELSQMLDDLQTDLSLAGMKLVCAQIGERSTVGQDRDDLDAIRLAQANRWDNDADILAGPVLYDVNLSDGGAPADGLHFRTDAEGQTLANRWWRMLDYAFYGGSDGRAPQFAAATHTGATVTVTLTGGAGALQNGTDTTGWRVVDDNGERTVSAASLSGSAITLTVDQALSGAVLVSFGSGNDGVGATLSDSGTYPMPPEPFVSETATATDIHLFVTSLPIVVTNISTGTARVTTAAGSEQ